MGLSDIIDYVRGYHTKAEITATSCCPFKHKVTNLENP